MSVTLKANEIVDSIIHFYNCDCLKINQVHLLKYKTANKNKFFILITVFSINKSN